MIPPDSKFCPDCGEKITLYSSKEGDDKYDKEYEEIFGRIKKLIVDHNDIAESKITDNAMLSSDLNLDSLDAMELVMDCEKEFDIVIPDKDVARLSKISDVIAYIKGARSHK